MFTRNKDVLKIHPTIIERGIKIVSQMKYLGVTLDCKLDWYPHTQYLENKLLRIRNSHVRCSTATWGLTFHNLMTIYKYAIFQSPHTPQRPGVPRCPKELKANCNKTRQPSSFL